MAGDDRVGRGERLVEVSGFRAIRGNNGTRFVFRRREGDWASIPLPDARPNQIVVEASQNIGAARNANLEDTAIVSSESITPS